MKKLFKAMPVFLTLMILSAFFMFWAALDSSYIYFPIHIAMEPVDLSRFFMFLAFLAYPIELVRKIDARKKTRYIRFAPIFFLPVLLLYPVRFTADTWHWYESGGSQAKSRDAWFGYEPFWKVDYNVQPAFASYETNESNQRETYISNGIWGEHVLYTLNSWVDGSYSEEQAYECVQQTTWHFLGYFWRTDNEMELSWTTNTELLRERCALIASPYVSKKQPVDENAETTENGTDAAF